MKVAIFTRITARKPTIKIVGGIVANVVIYTYRENNVKGKFL